MKAKSCYCYHLRLEIWHFISAITIFCIEIGEEFAKDVKERFRITIGSIYLWFISFFPLNSCGFTDSGFGIEAKTCTTSESLVQQSQFPPRLKFKEYIMPNSFPLRTSWRRSPVRELKIRMFIPFSLAVATLSPFRVMAMAPSTKLKRKYELDWWARIRLCFSVYMFTSKRCPASSVGQASKKLSGSALREMRLYGSSYGNFMVGRICKTSSVKKSTR